MASLKNIIREKKDIILDGIAWVVIWKEGRSWNSEYFYPEDGDYENGYIFSAEDFNRLNEIAGIDHKAICINGYYMGFGDESKEESCYNTARAVEERVLWMYTERLNQLEADFIDGYCINSKQGGKENFQFILEHIKDKVIVTGSYAYGTQTECSDIDLYIKEIPEDERELNEYYEVVDENYCHELIKFIEKLGYQWSSCFISSFAVDDTYIPLEFSAYYDIEEEELFDIEILGVKMKAAKSNHTSDKYLNGQKRSKLGVYNG